MLNPCLQWRPTVGLLIHMNEIRIVSRWKKVNSDSHFVLSFVFCQIWSIVEHSRMLVGLGDVAYQNSNQDGLSDPFDFR